MEAGGRRVGVLAHKYTVCAGLVARQHDADAIDADAAELVCEAAPEIGQDGGAVGAGGSFCGAAADTDVVYVI